LARGSSAAFPPGEASDVEISADNLAGLLRRVSEASTREIENLTGDLQALRKKLHTDGDRIQRDIAEYGELAQQVMQLTKIISESVKKLPTPPRVNRRCSGLLVGEREKVLQRSRVIPLRCLPGDSSTAKLRRNTNQLQQIPIQAI
jgi:hypothetical protein